MPAPTRRTIPLGQAEVRVERREDDDARTITGYAALTYDGTPDTEYELWKGSVERIAPGAFNRAAAEDDVRGLFNHDSDHLLGRTTAGTMRLTVDAKGLRYEIDAPDTQAGRDVVTSIDRGDLSGSSFSFRVTDERWTEEGDLEVRTILAVELFDVGPVTFPAYTNTTAGTREADLAEARSGHDAWQAERAAATKTAVTARARQRLARAIEVETEATYG